ncbi:hypothetical protein BZG01_17710 [Labilibaculum manganireducens]|uniref:Uncharacterized protein n=1 Tax=Labilibaculum manganireducens TaxID=1940525 RepID=A0A2N3HVQ5_9BACT|nr:hypothetical protein [Labilibaculum manganireducens]PKQ62156.1 hypothetical protein BZG01_17710 [Labilibaculum manganireducens]
MLFNHPKFCENADLVSVISQCPFDSPVDNCPFRQYYMLQNEILQIQELLYVPENQLDKMRDFHRECFKKQIHKKKVRLDKDWKYAASILEK